MTLMSGLYRSSFINPQLLRTCHRSIHTSSIRTYRDAQFRRSDYDGQGWTSSYEPGAATKGPLSQASKHGVPSLTPLSLKTHLDKFVVGQDRAKKVTCVSIYNHYQRIRELRRQEAEEQERREQYSRRHLYERERSSHPVDNEYVGHAIQTADLNAPPYHEREYEEEPELGSRPLEDFSSNRTIIEKSNLMLLGPSGVGKTYILQTLARVLEVPFATVDCSSLTQAGYIGTDIESSIERLLLASSQSVQKCETGIIFFDEIDKLAKPAALEAIASRALYGSSSPASSSNSKSGNGTSIGTGIGARGLRSIMENVLQEIMFIGPSSPNIRYVLVDEAFVKGLDTQSSQFNATPASSSSSIPSAASSEDVTDGRTRLPRCFHRNERNIFEEALEEEEEIWKQRNGIVPGKEGEGKRKGDADAKPMESFQEYRVVAENEAC
ncbi:hypothetical protein DID88_006192 [Monilinia fructigena]|uniref:AAA+ ATPase domain-containing protein n=1 Tax=Monilinia fructigena TaxID=38457 RepID=A0A395J200_9HELO|nr:hypothetical protein DID88_006192 [Monilinia fructigena]